MLLPLKKVDVKSEIRGSFAVTNVELRYVNPHKDVPLECTYVFPVEKSTILAKFEAMIDNRVVVTKIMEKEKAQEKFDDAVACGHAAVMAMKDDTTMSVSLGNLLPGQEAVLKQSIISQLEVVGGSFAYNLPSAFYPDYRRHGVRNPAEFAYEFNYEVRIIAESSHVSSLSLPQTAEIVEQSEKKDNILIRSAQTGRQFDLFFKTADMMVPQLLYAEHPETGEVACSVSLVPTFDPVAPQDVFNVVKDEKPEQSILGSGSDYHFIFIIDRSGSMGFGSNRMETAKEALSLFIRSLPSDSKFSVISFGSHWDCLKPDILTLNDETKNMAVGKIDTF